MSLITASHQPPLTATADTTILEACRAMADRNVGAIAVFEGDRLAGIFTERDALRKVIVGNLDPSAVRLRDVMTTPCETIRSSQTTEDALALMVSKTIHHLGLIDDSGKLLGMVSYRTLMSQKISALDAEVDHLSAYLGSDGIGGD